MNRTTTGICLAALLVSCCMNSVLRADEIVPQNDFFVADESRHQWVNEHNGRTGQLLVRGALLSSPCILETNTVALPLPQKKEGMKARHVLALDLLGCGDGGEVTSASSPAGRDSMMVMQSALLTGVEGGVLQPEQRMVSHGRAVVYGGANRFTYYLSDAQVTAMGELSLAGDDTDRNVQPLLQLRLDYE